jgi:MFS family permease
MTDVVRANIRRYYLYQFFISLDFWAPVLVLFWQARGLDLTQIMLLQSIYALGVIVLELPTGALADYFGKKISLISGALFFAGGLFIYGISLRFWQFAVGELVVAAGMAFISGADRAFVRETLTSCGREKAYTSVEGRVRGITQIARAGASVAGGLIASLSLGLTLIAGGLASFIGALIGMSFTETKLKLPREEQTEYFQIIKDSLRIVRNNGTVLWLGLFLALFNSLVWTTNWFAQPYLQMLGVPVVYFGVIFAGFRLASALASSLTDQFERMVQRPFLLMAVASVVSMFLIGTFPSLYIFPLWAVWSAFMILNQTLVSDRILTEVPAGRAATVLSFMNLVRRFVYALIGPVLGKIGDLYGILTAIQVNAVVLFIVLGTLFLLRERFRMVGPKTHPP